MRKSLSLRYLVAVGVLLLSASALLSGQTLSGINGTVTDKTGAVVPDATVTATNKATQVSSTRRTSSAGGYTITDLIPGSYTVKVEKAGFQSFVLEDVRVEVAAYATADAVMQVGNTSEMVEVKADAVSLETDQPEVGTTIEKTLVDEVPVELNHSGGVQNTGRQIDAYLFLAPGVTGGSFSHRIGSAVDFQNEVVFNGVPAIQAETHGFQTFINPPFEMVNEFQVVSTNFSPQYGLAQGAAAYQFASGTNRFHGDAFELMRNDYFDAKGGAPALDAAGVPLTPTDKEDNYGFTIGGPVILPYYNGRDKTFFHVSWEQYRLNQSVNGTMTVPTPAMEQGNFSQFPANIYVPQVPLVAGCTPGAAPGQPFPGNIIPSDCISANSKSLLATLPVASSNTNFNSNFLSTLVSPTRQTSWGFTIDHNLTQNQSVHGSFWRDEDTNFNFNNGGAPLPATNPLTTGQNGITLGTGLFLTYSNALTSHLVMTAGFGWMGEINNNTNPNLGLTFPAVVGSSDIPAINFTGDSAVSSPTSFGATQTATINRKLGLTFVNNWLWTHGKNNYSMGFEVRHAYQDDHECGNCGGSFTFSSLTTDNPNNLGTAGSSFASFLLGEADSANLTFSAETKLRNFSVSPYFQDHIKINSRLTVDAGIRWDIMVPFIAEDNPVLFFDPTLANPGAISAATGQPLLGAATALGHCAACAGYDRASIHWLHFAPRLGFAYELDRKTVVRGGYSIAILDDGAYEYGDNKVANTYGQLLAGNFVANSNGSNIPGFGQWDSLKITPTAPTAVGPTVQIGTGNLHEFSQDDGLAPYVHMWSIGLQRELPWRMFLSADYLGNKAIHLPAQLDNPNQLNPQFLTLGGALGQTWTSAAGQAALQSLGFGQSGGLFTPFVGFLNLYGPNASMEQALAPFPQYNLNGIQDNFDLGGASFYQAAQFNLRKSSTNGMTFLANYTLSRVMSNTDSGFAIFNGGALNAFNQKAQWSVADNDQEHIINLSGVYELPIGPGKPFLNGNSGALAKNLLGGWQLSTVITYASGTPFGIGVNTGQNPLADSPLGTGNRANVVAGQPFNLNWNNYYLGLPIINLNAFAAPAPFTLGTSPRNFASLRNPWSDNESAALAKKFSFTERVGAEVRMEYFNIFNRDQICGFDTNVNDPTFGLINGGAVNTPGGKCQANSPRQGQVFLKVVF
jgi:hypothetical protein